MTAKSTHLAAPAQRRQTTFAAASALLVLGAALYASPSQAQSGPRVGEVLGAPNIVSTTVQARVLASTPVVAQVAVTNQVCRDETYETPARSSGAGAVLGAIAGGVAGNAVGKGAGKALATGVGIIGGAIVGDHVETDGRAPNVQTVRRCDPQTSYENRVVAYSVTYEYAGQRYTTQTVQEPGPTIPLQITITPMVQAPVTTTPTPTYVQPGYYPDRPRRRWGD